MSMIDGQSNDQIKFLIVSEPVNLIEEDSGECEEIG